MPLPPDAVPISQLNLPPDATPINQESPKKSGSAMPLLAAAGLGGAVATGVGYGVKKGYQALAPTREKMAGDLINSIIKPRHKEYMFGKNPGLGIAKEGIWGINLESIGKKVEKRLQELNTYSKEFRSLPENQTKTVNLEKVLDPFYEALDELGKAPETHKAKINEIYGMVKDIERNLPKGLNIKEVPIENAYGIKKVVEGMQKWNVENTGDHILNSKLRNVYHNVDAAIDVALPELKSINSRMANLISAKKAITNRAEILSRRDPVALGNILSLPIRGTIGSTGVKSTLAKILTEKFGIIKKNIPTVLGIVPIISQAIDFQQDPERTLLEIMGLQPSSKGSEEREVQMGRLL